MPTYAHASDWDAIALDPNAAAAKTFSESYLITDNESPPSSMAMLPTPHDVVVDSAGDCVLPGRLLDQTAPQDCADCDAEDGIYDFCEKCRQRSQINQASSSPAAPTRASTSTSTSFSLLMMQRKL